MIEALEAARTERDAFLAALDAWQRLRDPLLGTLVVHLGSKLRGPALERGPQFQTRWIDRAAARRSEDVESLLEGLVHEPDDGSEWAPGANLALRFARLLRRIEALATFPDDPRVARGLATLVKRGPFDGGHQVSVEPVYEPILDLVVRLGDAHANAELAALQARPVHRHPAVRASLAALLPVALTRARRGDPLDDDLHARIEAIAARFGVVPEFPPPEPASDEGMVLAIHESPDDDRLREVYADWLQERGDPRGEFIALQFAEARGAARPKDLKRAAALLRTHLDRWLGDLTLVTKQRTFRRGMLEEAELASESSAEPDVWRRALEDDRWSTVRTLHKGKANEALYIRLLASPIRRSLRNAQAQSHRTVDALVRSTQALRIERVRLERPKVESFRALAETKQLPCLAELEVVSDEPDTIVDGLRESGLDRRLGRLVLATVNPYHAPPLAYVLTMLEKSGIPEFGTPNCLMSTRGTERMLLVREFIAPQTLRSVPKVERVRFSLGTVNSWVTQMVRAHGRQLVEAAQHCAPLVELDPSFQSVLEGS